jgi:hypothetical protein
MNLHGSNPAKNTANTVFRIRIGFNADPDPAFYLNADPDPDPGQTLPSQKVKFYIKNTL